ncbi:hypothetical protein Taro_047683 [Colocasia esculenta]|uniref:Aminotransferase-like plant mobile domain-containing protein n=1 Tax=Colocasia esculenta TaxID=4460 RepID=A0A843X1B4_COLES|nr:hypothetical protein [Colocasia esculenta]
MGFGEVLRMDRMRPDPALTQALHSRWDVETTAFIFPWGHMIPSLEDVSRITRLRVYGRPVSGFTYPGYSELAHRLLGLTVEARSSLVPRVALQESLGLYDVGKQVGETVDGQLQRLIRGCRAVLAEEPGAEADLDLRRFLILFLGRLLFATRGDSVHCRSLPLLEDLDEVGNYAWGAAFLAHQFDSLGAFERLTSTSGFFPFLQVVWQPYLEEGDEGQPWLVQARPYFGRSVWIHAFNLMLPLYLFLAQRSLGLRQSAVEFPSRDRTARPGRSFRGLHDTMNWRVRAKEQIDNWERKGKQVHSEATSDDAYLQAFTLKYGARVYRSRRRQDRATTQRETEQLQKELERVRSAEGAGGSSSRASESSQLDLEDRLAAAVRKAEKTQTELAERVDATTGERDRLRIWAEAAELLVAETTRELATLRVQGSSVDQTEMVRLRTEVTAQQIRIDELRGLVTTLGQAPQSSRSRSRSGVSRESGASVGQYLVGSSSHRRNEEEERCRRGEASAQSGRGGGEMPPPPERQEGSGESGGGQ